LSQVKKAKSQLQKLLREPLVTQRFGNQQCRKAEFAGVKHCYVQHEAKVEISQEMKAIIDPVN
jgi:hypothetical protein